MQFKNLQLLCSIPNAHFDLSFKHSKCHLKATKLLKKYCFSAMFEAPNSFFIFVSHRRVYVNHYRCLLKLLYVVKVLLMSNKHGVVKKMIFHFCSCGHSHLPRSTLNKHSK